MKRLKFTLKFFGGCLLVLVVLFIYVINWGSKRALDYKIDDISMERVVLDDSACYEHQHYLVSLTISPVHYKYGFWEGNTFLKDFAEYLGKVFENSIQNTSIFCLSIGQ